MQTAELPAPVAEPHCKIISSEATRKEIYCFCEKAVHQQASLLAHLDAHSRAARTRGEATSKQIIQRGGGGATVTKGDLLLLDADSRAARTRGRATLTINILLAEQGLEQQSCALQKETAGKTPPSKKKNICPQGAPRVQKIFARKGRGGARGFLETYYRTESSSLQDVCRHGLSRSLQDQVEFDHLQWDCDRPQDQVELKQLQGHSDDPANDL